MNRRDLFKRAGKVAAGLGLAAVVPQIPDLDDGEWVESETKFGYGWTGEPPPLPMLGDEVRIASVFIPADYTDSSITLTIDQHQYAAFELEEFDGSQTTLTIDSWKYISLEPDGSGGLQWVEYEGVA